MTKILVVKSRSEKLSCKLFLLVSNALYRSSWYCCLLVLDNSDIFKKPSESTDDDADNGMLKHIVADISENKAGPDLNMKTNGHPFNGHFLLRGSVPRPAVIAISSGKSKIACTFPEHEKDQPVHFCASSIHGVCSFTESMTNETS